MKRSEYFQHSFWFENIRSSFSSDTRTFVCADIPTSRTKAALPLVIDQINGGVTTFSACRFGSVYFSDYLDFPGIDFSTQGTVDEIISTARSQNADVVWLSNIPAETVLGKTLACYRNDNASCHVLGCIPTVGIDCPDTYDNYLASLSKNNRRNIRRKTEALTLLGVTHQIVPATEEKIISLLGLQQMRAADQDSLDPLNADLNVTKFLTSLVGKPGVEISEVLLDGKPISQILLLRDKTTLAVLAQGFDPKYNAYSPSFVNLAKTIEHAISTGISYIDFLRGDESYKQHFVNNRIDMIKFVAILNPNLDETEVISFINNYQE